MTLEEHYRTPKERLVQYDHLLKDLVVCAQKEYLHGVSFIKVCIGGVVRGHVIIM